MGVEGEWKVEGGGWMVEDGVRSVECGVWRRGGGGWSAELIRLRTGALPTAYQGITRVVVVLLTTYYLLGHLFLNPGRLEAHELCAVRRVLHLHWRPLRRVVKAVACHGLAKR